MWSYKIYNDKIMLFRDDVLQCFGPDTFSICYTLDNLYKVQDFVYRMNNFFKK